MSFLRSISVPLVAWALAWSAGSAEAQTTLRLKFAKGQVNNYEMKQEMKMAQNAAGNNIDMEMKQTIEMSQTVDEVAGDGSAKVTTKMTRVIMEIKGPFAVSLDSANLKDADDNPIGKMMAGVVKTLAKVEFVATQKPTGEMVDLKIPEALLKEFLAMPGSAMMGDMFTEEGIKQMMSQGSMVLPKDAIAAGGSWTQKTTTKLPTGKMSGEMKYTYQGTETVEGKTFQKIAYVPTFTLDADPNAAAKIAMKSQKGAGVILFDNELGRLHEMAMDNVMEMSVGVANFNIDQVVTQKVSMKLRK